ncbi:MAG: hypothetical protein R3F39_16525 [Myxococcota bacterium]
MGPRLAALALFAVASAGCGRAEESPQAAEAAATAQSSAQAPRATPATPATEEALLRAATDAIAARDLAALKRTAAPELAADLERMFGNGPEEFWARGDLLVANVRSGIRVAQAEDGATGRWRVLFQFGNGVEETMTFARVDRELRIDQL